MRTTSGILLSAAAIGLGALAAATPAAADPLILIGPMAPVVAASGLTIGVPAAAPDKWRGRTEVAPAPEYDLAYPVTAYAAPVYWPASNGVCTIQTQRTPYGWRDVSVCD
jgi:hypothetical protein